MLTSLRHLLTLCAFLPAFFAAATSAQTPEPGESIRVYVVTLSPGTNAVWERFGHNALVIEDPTDPREDRRSVAYNWGTFDFDQPNFVGRFIMGRMLYMLTVWPVDLMLDMYRREDRTISVIELNLTPAEKLRLRSLAETNARPENAEYRYDYYRDNCSTRIRDIIDQALDGAVQRALSDRPTDSTYRSHTRRLTATAWHWNFALNYIMGHPIDQPLSEWEAGFIPAELERSLKSITLPDGRPLVSGATVLHQSTRPPPPSEVPDFRWINLLIGLLVGSAMVGAAGLMRIARRTGIAVLLLLGMGWTLLGAAGAGIGLWGWIFTDHVVAARNENLLVISLLGLPLLVMLPVWLIWKRAPRWTIGLAAGNLLLCMLAIGLKALPWFYQPNAEIILLALPIHAGLLIALLLVHRGQWHRPITRTGGPA